MLVHFARLVCLAAAAVAAATWSLAAQADGKEQLRDVAKQLLPFFDAKPDMKLEQAFAQSFLNEFPFAQVQGAFRDFHTRFGKAQDVGNIKLLAPFKGEVEIRFANNVCVPTLLVIENQPPHRILGLKLLPPVVSNEKLEAVLADLKALPGRTALSLTRLGMEPRVIWELNADQPQPVGSAFKLVVLATLVDEIQKQKRTWTDIVPLRPEWKSLSSGLLQDWPAGSPLSLHTLATLMISRSDNTAADHLIRTLGRDRIEAMQKELGVQRPERNQPFLCSAEMFKIKLVLQDNEQDEYVKADTEGRRRFLDAKLEKVQLASPRTTGKPLYIDDVEWVFSMNDMCRILNWLRRDEHARAILSINSGLVVNTDHWKYAGYKGGAEPGVLSFILLLQNPKGEWFAFAIGWSDTKKEVDVTRLMDLAHRFLRVAEKLPSG